MYFIPSVLLNIQVVYGHVSVIKKKLSASIIYKIIQVV